MAIINSWNGGIKIVTQAEIDAQRASQQGGEGQRKFDTCKNRSEKEVVKMQHSCCTSTKVHGYECKRRKIFPLESAACAECPLYEKK